jgi:ketosteroid isomerase-like protein
VTQTEDNLKLAETLLGAVESQDLELLSSLFHDDAEYTDVATPEDDVARGGEEVALRLGLALEGVEISNTSRHLIASDDVVMAERVEQWRWRTGEALDLPIATVIEISGQKISRWIDYWDMQTFLAVAPGWWMEHVMKGWKT